MLKPALSGNTKNNYNNSHLILGFLILGRVCSTVFAETTPADDYVYDEESPADELKASDMQPKSTMKPFFESPNITIYARVGEKVVLDCPLKNYNDRSHQLLWSKGNTTLTNGHIALNPIYELDTYYNLTIVSLTKETEGHYYCSAQPFKNVRRQVLVKIGEPETITTTKPQPGGADGGDNAGGSGWRGVPNMPAISLVAVVGVFSWI